MFVTHTCVRNDCGIFCRDNFVEDDYAREMTKGSKEVATTAEKMQKLQNISGGSVYERVELGFRYVETMRKKIGTDARVKI